ncbi:tRNA preQ1(34) S-adenosylmethionine ribosyltransferase-isomerase QueA [Telmatocola sphagniphila]|uniref:S-adenosylmethionine:tRNA ribosyltransferase-isomerase n=1 Tax=Telmatocola sphagniphila TaxID=1123043 RepID=A0A8E6B5Q5_9BACT|nr:tRNA preQ1(34) S-adenosylmethionine ribosyltransferase-isomerase QueA [Telmatocola sphagniphila]QVL31764.1 tRNA preQ1(34) S-adenosylmethionine ribosyltransferase-isomerase QueA [Telmatocola sphagniphila]
MFWDYELPEELIAQQPAEPRDSSRLLRLDVRRGNISHHLFRDLPELLAPNDLLIVNDSRVLPARLLGTREKTGGKWEALFLKTTAEGFWETLAKCGGNPQVGEILQVRDFRLIYRGRVGDHSLFEPASEGSFVDLLERFGSMPLPPYIRKGVAQSEDRDRYQTVFNSQPGSVAAPTAGLHFTPELLSRLKQKGIESATVTLHVGLGTFEPVRTEDPTQHAMHAEWAAVSKATIEKIRQAKARGGRVIAVGTTSCRALESAGYSEWTGETQIFIHPPYSFRVVDALITNFHLPKTTLLLLVAALAGEENLKRAYETAIAERYRFYSYGDAMFVS